MKAGTDPCTVCGCTEVNLVDGFYYCTECGTQDVNTQETVVEHTFVHDNTVNKARTKKIKTALKDGMQMSGEWLKWHGFNFILHGLVEEMMALGASNSFREWVLLIWTKYMNLYMKKDKMGIITEASDTDNNGQNKSIFDVEEEDQNDEQQNDEDQDLNEDDCSEDDWAMFRRRTKFIKRTTLLSMLYLGLLYDNSSIQLSQLVKLMLEKKLSLKTCEKFLPKEIKITSIPDHLHFNTDKNCLLYTPAIRIRKIVWALIKLLDLELPEFPDCRKMVDVFVTELCLPSDFKNLVFSLMLKCPMKKLMRIKNKRKLLHYEAMVMSYVVVALKICFGLDGDYEIKISDAVDKINDEENHLKCYKLGPHSDTTKRLFSFREWSNYLQYRKVMLCKYYLPYADQYNLDTDIDVCLKQMGERPKQKVKLEDEITMEILGKIPSKTNSEVIPKSKFITTLTPLTSYTEVVATYIQDPEIKLLLSEDFSQYALKYACENFKLDVDGKNIIKGVSEENKIIRYVIQALGVEEVNNDQSIVYIKNCDNRNWLKTNPPSKEHITYTNIDYNAIEGDDESSGSDCGYSSNLESNERNINTLADEEEILEEIEEENENISIFDDPFDMKVKEDPESDDFWRQISEISNVQQNSHLQLTADISDDVGSDQHINDLNPETIDRAEIIKELVLHACKKYKINIPKNFRPTQLTPAISGEKRPRTETDPGQSAKRARLEKWDRIEASTHMKKILGAYHESVEKDFFNKISNEISKISNIFSSQPENEIMDVFDNESDVIPHEDASFNNNVDDTVDSSCIENSVQEIGTEDILPSINPNFDEKSHDINQLYIRCRDRLQFEDVLEFDDPEIEELLGKKVLESKNYNPSSDDKDLSETNPHLDDESLSTEKNKKEKPVKKFSKLVKNPKVIKKFHFWCRHYSDKIRGHDDLSEVFNADLRANTSKSFMFIMNECASILSCTTYNLYKYVNRLERYMWINE